ncbi:hypothetical protein [Streptomyces sp. NPDC006459]|uniref:hypothetical protein n=1 Tax=Streptomyces sp. NPDC006459 TaxID=3154303 RepID=UPI0033BDD6D8
MQVTRETKATLTAKNGGRVVAWHSDREPNFLSMAVPGDRVKLTPVEARNFAAWLIDAANSAETVDRSPLRTATLRQSHPKW